MNPTTVNEPTPTAIAAQLRPYYRDMAFARCSARAQALVDSLIEGSVPSPARTRTLGALMVWQGACLLLSNNSKDAAERFQLARILDPLRSP